MASTKLNESENSRRMQTCAASVVGQSMSDSVKANARLVELEISATSLNLATNSCCTNRQKSSICAKNISSAGLLQTSAFNSLQRTGCRQWGQFGPILNRECGYYGKGVKAEGRRSKPSKEGRNPKPKSSVEGPTLTFRCGRGLAGMGGQYCCVRAADRLIGGCTRMI